MENVSVESEPERLLQDPVAIGLSARRATAGVPAADSSLLDAPLKLEIAFQTMQMKDTGLNGFVSRRAVLLGECCARSSHAHQRTDGPPSP